jgi:hypothetical protein
MCGAAQFIERWCKSVLEAQQSPKAAPPMKTPESLCTSQRPQKAKPSPNACNPCRASSSTPTPPPFLATTIQPPVASKWGKKKKKRNCAAPSPSSSPTRECALKSLPTAPQSPHPSSSSHHPLFLFLSLSFTLSLSPSVKVQLHFPMT